MIFRNMKPVKVNNGRWAIGDHFEFYRPEFFQDASSSETLQFVL